MWRVPVIVAVAFAATGALTPAWAQKEAPAITRDSDRDGVPDIRDRCRNTPAATVVDANGCPAPATPPQTARRDSARTSPVQGQPVVGQATRRDSAGRGAVDTAAARRALEAASRTRPPPDSARSAAADTTRAAPPATDPDAARRALQGAGRRPAGEQAPGGMVPAGVTPGAPTGAAGNPPANAAANRPTQPGQPEVADAVLADVGAPVLSGGFFMPPSVATTEDGRLEYLRIFTVRLDSALNALVEVFRNTTQPPSATEPAGVSSRVRDRWDRCRRLYFDVRSFADGMVLVQGELPDNPLLERAATSLVEGVEGAAALQVCDNIGSAIEEPARWSPWQRYYDQSIRTFFTGWYTQLRGIHEQNRSLLRALNSMLPAERQISPFPALPPNPPTIGAF